MVADRGCPDASTMLGRREVFQQLGIALVQVVQRIIDDFPVDQVLGMQNGQAGRTLERRRRQIVVVARGAYADVRVAVVGINDGIGVGAVAIVGTPHLRFVLRMSCQRADSQQHKKQFFHRSLFILSL